MKKHLILVIFLLFSQLSVFQTFANESNGRSEISILCKEYKKVSNEIIVIRLIIYSDPLDIKERDDRIKLNKYQGLISRMALEFQNKGGWISGYISDGDFPVYTESIKVYLDMSRRHDVIKIYNYSKEERELFNAKIFRPKSGSWSEFVHKIISDTDYNVRKKHKAR
ncbi:MAG: hypothetical protein GY864_01310 [Desulfobacterales bacterium]|nr:hypothetical protein [Desulfobacterales bacterium]